MSTILHRFGIDPDGDPAAQFPRVVQLLEALVTNPHLEIGEQQSITVFPPTSAAGTVAAAANAPAAPAAFYRVYRDDDTWILQGGQVTAGTGSKVIDDIEIGTVGSEPADGNKVWIIAEGAGVVEDGRLFQGFNLDEDETVADSGADLPANTLPTVAESTGRKCHILLGEWTGARFYPSGPGGIQITFCPSSYYVTRF